MFPLPTPLLLAMPASAPAAGHAYWRVLISDNWGDASFVIVAEVEFLDAGGTLISPTGGTAINSSFAGSGNEADKAFDGSATTPWACGSGLVTNSWIGYHFPANKDVAQVRITTLSSGTNFLTKMPKNCALQYSDDGSSWTTAFSFLNVNLAGGSITYPETSGTGYHKAWRVFMTDNNGGTSFICLDELRLKATSGGANQIPAQSSNNGGSTGRVLFSSSLGAGNEGWRVVNGVTNTSNFWASSGASNAYVGFLFPVAVKVEEIDLVSANSNATRAPKNMTVDYSDDLTTWTTQKTLAAQTGWATNETRTLAAV